jgi:hypothetical protein
VQCFPGGDEKWTGYFWKVGVLVSDFQLTENALAQPEAFVAALTQSIEDIEEGS